MDSVTQALHPQNYLRNSSRHFIKHSEHSNSFLKTKAISQLTREIKEKTERKRFKKAVKEKHKKVGNLHMKARKRIDILKLRLKKASNCMT